MEDYMWNEDVHIVLSLFINSDWISSLSEDALSCFLRAAELGIELGEAWIVCSAAAYVWNYSNHILANNRHKEMIEPFQKILESFKKVGHAG